MIDSTRRSARQILDRLDVVDAHEHDLQQRVNRGTEYLNQHRPNWWHLFDERDVILRSVLQIPGVWTTFRNRVGLPYLRPDRRHALGFEVADWPEFPTNEQRYEAERELAVAWAALIEQCRGGEQS